MEGEGWEDEVEVAEGGASSRVTTGFNINDQSYKLYIETDEEGSQIFVYMYSPYKVSPARMPEMARLLNSVNCVFNAGRLACFDDDDSNPVQFLWKIPVRDSDLTPEEVGAMVAAAVQVYDIYGNLLAQCIFSNKTAKQLWAEFQAEREDAKEQSSGEGPTEL
jgi:hypothetical protein